MITLDDLVAEGAVNAEALRAIVTAQLEVEAPHKPAGLFIPKGRAAKGGALQAGPVLLPAPRLGRRRLTTSWSPPLPRPASLTACVPSGR